MAGGVSSGEQGETHRPRPLRKPPLFMLMKDRAGRTHQGPGEPQIPELQILLLNLHKRGSLITFSGNLPDSAFSGSTRWLSRRTAPRLTESLILCLVAN